MVAVITNIDREHMDHYRDEAALRAAFLDFANQVPFYGVVVVCADNPTAAGLLPELLKRHVTYGLDAGDYRGEILAADAQGTRLRVRVRDEERGELVVRMPGVHYAQNALAALCVAEVFGVPFATTCEALAAFGGVDRRFSVRGEAGGVLVVDDYGHHPTEIAATIAAAKLYGRRLLVAFQAHRYTRTKDLLASFAPALAGADEVVLTDIYPAGEAAIAGVDAHALLRTFPPGAAVSYATRSALAGQVVTRLRPGDLLLTLGAGDITQVAAEVLGRLASSSPH
jgi:UDP-N-acetylmuramate--alanine ligase